jgi:hypothetical protein
MNTSNPHVSMWSRDTSPWIIRSPEGTPRPPVSTTADMARFSSIVPRLSPNSPNNTLKNRNYENNKGRMAFAPKQARMGGKTKSKKNKSKSKSRSKKN